MRVNVCRVGCDNVIASDVRSSRRLLESGPFSYCDVMDKDNMARIILENGITHVLHLATLLSGQLGAQRGGEEHQLVKKSQLTPCGVQCQAIGCSAQCLTLAAVQSRASHAAATRTVDSMHTAMYQPCFVCCQ